MNKATVAILGLGRGLASMAVQPPGQAFPQDQPIYGRQLMTEQERLEYGERMRAATTEEEREQIRLEHHARMQERAAELGIELPDAPPVTGMGRGMGQGPGMGAGQGGMMRQGARSGRGN
jgi:hypothetical protein